jgi:uncharacterized protein (TIGR02266 family)
MSLNIIRTIQQALESKVPPRPETRIGDDGNRIQELRQHQVELEEEKHRLEAEAVTSTAQLGLVIEEQARLADRRQALEELIRDTNQRREQVALRAFALEEELEALTAAAEQALAQPEPEPEAAAAEQAPAQREPEAPPEEPARLADQPPVAIAGAERRRAPRVKIAADVSFNTDHNFYAGLTNDLSEGGIFIATFENLPEGTNLDLTLTLPEYGTIEARGVVRWIRTPHSFNQDFPAGIGVQFVDLKETDRAAIQTFICQRDPLLYEV